MFLFVRVCRVLRGFADTLADSISSVSTVCHYHSKAHVVLLLLMSAIAIEVESCSVHVCFPLCRVSLVMWTLWLTPWPASA